MAWFNLGLLSTLILVVGTLTATVMSTLAEVDAENKYKKERSAAS